MIQRFWLGVAVLLSVTVVSLSAEVMSLDKDACLSRALSNNSDLLSAALRLETSRRAEEATWNVFLPEMNASVGLAGSVAAAEGASTRAFGINPGLSVSYMLTPGIRESIHLLDLEVEKDSINYEEVRLRLLMSVESEFYYLLTIRNNLEIVRKNIELADRQYEQTRIKFTSGLVSELEVLQARVNAANLRPGYSSLKTAYRSRLKEFLAVLGIDPQTEVELVGSLDVEDRTFDADNLIETYLENRTDIRAQRKQLEMLNNSLTFAKRNGRLPHLTFSASWVENLSFPFSAAGAGSMTLAVKLGLDDYIPGSSTDIGIREIEDAIASAELLLEDLILSAGLEIRNVIDSLATDRENLELSRLNLELSEKSYRMTEESFLKGRSNRMQLDDAQQDLLTARQNLLESRYEYMNDLLRLRGALGLDSLEELEK